MLGASLVKAAVVTAVVAASYEVGKNWGKIKAWLQEKTSDDSWEGISEESLKGKSAEEVEKAIPEDWPREATRGEGGTRYKHPTNLGEQVRVMPGQLSDPNPVKRGPYARISRQRKTSDPIPLKGNPTLQQ